MRGQSHPVGGNSEDKGPVAAVSLVFSGAKSRSLWLDSVYRGRYQIMKGFP